MNENQVKEGQKLLKEIKETEEFYNVFNNGYVKYLQGWEQGEEEVFYHVEEDLRIIISDYLLNKLNKLKQDFENL